MTATASWTRRRLLASGAGFGAFAALGSPARAQDENIRYFRIGTGAAGGTYYPIGAVLANVISNPPGSRPCERGGACGVPGLIATAQTTQGSVQNVEELAAGRFEAALCQADIAYWAYRGERVFQGKPPFAGLRLIATLYPELVHLMVRRDSGITRVGDLKKKRVSLGEPGSGTLVHARIVLEAHALAPEDLEPSSLRIGEAADALRHGRIDAFFFTGGAPVGAIAALAEAAEIAMVPIAGAPTEPLRRRFPFFTAARLASATYKGVVDTPTLSVNTLWLVDAKADADTVYGITKALWNPSTKALLEKSHPIGKQIALDRALETVSIPLHPGAERYYREAGKIPSVKPIEGNQ
ncbi:MAG: TAXI family TRAP transporter solute-binding subunit [Rhodospirillaceae bacterium]|nr:TAXI family TRAP transporter solute-binding subunit [Rhodospirillaceae bacterium]